jgi:hypothetical protein
VTLPQDGGTRKPSRCARGIVGVPRTRPQVDRKGLLWRELRPRTRPRLRGPRGSFPQGGNPRGRKEARKEALPCNPSTAPPRPAVRRAPA